jgi:uncharacterized protein YcnI
VLIRAAALAAALVLVPAAPALAHVEASVTPAQALATNASVTLVAESESRAAGITGLRIQLPAGLVPGDLRLTAAPRAWKLAGSGQVATVSGPALPVGQDLELTMRVRQLPAGSSLVLKTVQSYADGQEDAWVEVPSASVPDPDNPAPTVRLAAPAPGATQLPRATTPAPVPTTTPAPTTPAPTTLAPTAAPTPTPVAADPEPDSGSSGVGWLFAGVGIGVVALLGVLVALRRKAG